jgi:hypothetical protein
MSIYLTRSGFANSPPLLAVITRIHRGNGAQLRRAVLCQSTKVNGRLICSSGRRSATTPQRASTNAAAIISAAAKM